MTTPFGGPVQFFLLSKLAIILIATPVLAMVGGQVSAEGQFEGLVRLDSAKCSGVMITRQHILTAGHCVMREPGKLTIPDEGMLITLHSRKNQAQRVLSVHVAIARRDVHPTWEKNLRTFSDPDEAADHPQTSDLGIYTLAHELPVDPVELASGGSILDSRLIVTGSGCETPNGFPLGQLKSAELEALTLTDQKIVVGTVNQRAQAQGERVELCHGDSGSPALSSEDPSAKIIAINSTRLPLDSGDTGPMPGVLARVDLPSVQSWIRHVKAKSPRPMLIFPRLDLPLLQAIDLMAIAKSRSDFPTLQKKLDLMKGSAQNSMPPTPALLSDAEIERLALRISESGNPAIVEISTFLSERSHFHPQLLWMIHGTRSTFMPIPLKRMNLLDFLDVDPAFKNLTSPKQEELLQALMRTDLPTLQILGR